LLTDFLQLVIVKSNSKIIIENFIAGWFLNTTYDF
jgi:hypothetical protein